MAVLPLHGGRTLQRHRRRIMCRCMTYGVDQCRVCGKPIRPSDSQAMDRYLNSLRHKPTMTEKEWRAAGLKAAPTRKQTLNTLDGVCFACQFPIGLRMVPLLKLYLPLVGLLMALLLAVFFLGSAFT